MMQKILCLMCLLCLPVYLGAVEMIMHFDGTGNSFSDSLGHTITQYGSPTQTSTTSVAGGKSLYLDGSSYLSIQSPGDFLFGTKDFTVDFWFKSSATYRMHPLSFGNSTSDNTDFDFNDSDNASGFWLYNHSGGTNAIIFGSQGQYTNNVWHHIAVVRKSGIITTYLDGVAKGTLSFPTTLGATEIKIGRGSYGTWYWQGYLDELRIVNDTALFTTNFDPIVTCPPVPEPQSILLLILAIGCIVFRKNTKQ